jgi:hypothetical protein
MDRAIAIERGAGGRASRTAAAAMAIMRFPIVNCPWDRRTPEALTLSPGDARC